MKIALAQINPTVGDIEGNAAKILSVIEQARAQSASVVIFPEMALVGYPPRDLLTQAGFIERIESELTKLASQVKGITALVGCVQSNVSRRGRKLHNSVAVIADGEVKEFHHKTLLPTYDVFDEHRYFEPGKKRATAGVGGKKFGISICEDLWTVENVLGRVLYHDDPIAELAAAGAEIFVNAAASPFGIGKSLVRSDLVAEHAKRHRLPLVYVNQVGGNDELVFDGASCVYSADGELIARAKSFEEDLLIVDVNGGVGASRIEALPAEVESVYCALKLGLRDYIDRCGFRGGAVVGLSGGIDSSVVAAIAADALGAEKVVGVLMPSRFSSDHSLSDAEALAKNLGMPHHVIAIEPAHAAFESMLSEAFAGRKPDVTEENIQARIRGVLLMAFSNKFGSLLLTTGNKSELAMGYCTMYGDMAGGMALISDIPKQLVYELGRFINREREIIPQNVFDKAPSAELRPNQKDQDSLPPYELLDQVLKLYVEDEKSCEEIIAAGFDRSTVERIVVTVDRNEYKRKQAATGLKVTGKAFGSGRRMPIAQRFRQFVNRV